MWGHVDIQVHLFQELPHGFPSGGTISHPHPQGRRVLISPRPCTCQLSCLWHGQLVMSSQCGVQGAMGLEVAGHQCRDAV